MAAPKDRLAALLATANNQFNGIDFVEVFRSDEKTLRVHFLNQVALAGTITQAAITGGETIPTVGVHKINDATDWQADKEGRPILTLTTDEPGDFSFYTLSLQSATLDPFYSQAAFSFKALCTSTLDCEAPPAPCPPLQGDPPPIDYMAKDFLSFKQALTDFSALRYPEWQERSEADFGVMFVEALSSLADDLSYTQDRIAAEATLPTATQRRSLLRHARLVDYEPQPATSSQVLIQCDVAGGPLRGGVEVNAAGPDGLPIFFETGNSLVDPATGLPRVESFTVKPQWNRLDGGGNPRILPYWWDDSQRCLEAGATEMWVAGHGFQFETGQSLLLDTQGESPADPPIRETVVLSYVREETDQLLNQLVTHLFWGRVPSSTWRANTGGAAYHDSQGEAWDADEDFTGGAAQTTATPVQGTADPTLYQSARSGSSFTYSFDVAPDNYQVTLKFAEISNLVTLAGQRVFSVFINQTQVLVDFDILASAINPFTALDRVFAGITPDAQGRIVVQFGPASVGEALVSAIQIVGAASLGSVQSPGLKYEHDLTKTLLAGNLVPATQGRRFTETFAIDQSPTGTHAPLAVERMGPNNSPDSTSVQYSHTLRSAPLVWLSQPGLDSLPLPEILLQDVTSGHHWIWRRSLLDAQESEESFTVDPARFLALPRNSDGTVTFDYDGDAGETVRFGDGVFGNVPPPQDLFTATYRVGRGAAGNVAADSITQASSPLVQAVTNPFPAAGGADEETDEQVRRRAPQAFQAVQYRAVRPEDYEAAAERLPWVLRAGTNFRWTGSWLSVFTTADPEGSESIPVSEHLELIDLLNRYRMAGYESYTPSPCYVGLDLAIEVCAKPDAFRGDVQAAVLQALGTGVFPDGSPQFFNPDNFTFGTPLEFSALEAAVQKAVGVAGVTSVTYFWRGMTLAPVELNDANPLVKMGPDQVLRVDNDFSRPQRGSLTITVDGGK
jgi:hypothetical protein